MPEGPYMAKPPSFRKLKRALAAGHRLASVMLVRLGWPSTRYPGAAHAVSPRPSSVAAKRMAHPNLKRITPPPPEPVGFDLHVDGSRVRRAMVASGFALRISLARGASLRRWLRA